MATGDVTVIDEFLEDFGEAIHNISGGGNAILFGLITSATTPAANTADPRWGAGGTTNWSTNEVTAGGNYSAGGPTLAGQTYTETTGTATFDTNDVSILQNGSNPTNARWAIIYNDTDAGNRVIEFLDLGADTDLSAGDFTVTWNASGHWTLA